MYSGEDNTSNDHLPQIEKKKGTIKPGSSTRFCICLIVIFPPTKLSNFVFIQERQSSSSYV